MAPSSRTFRYGRAWIAGPTEVVEDELRLDREGVDVPATLVRPRRSVGPLPAWVVLHGITRPGRAHAQLVRFTHSLSAAGLLAIVPEVPEWRELTLAPHLTVPTVRAAVRALRSSGLARDERVGVIGFSFGAPHAIASAGAPGLADEIAVACGFGGYCAVEPTFRFMMTGEMTGGATTPGAPADVDALRPDPYGRWIVAANYLTAIPDHADALDVAAALRALARSAGDNGASSWDPVYDATIDNLRFGVAEERRTLFDLFATRSDSPSPLLSRRREALGLAEALADAGRRVDPDVDPLAALARVRCPVHVLHGRLDHVIPFTEAFRFQRALPAAPVHTTVTRLFGHSAQDRVSPRAILQELPRFVRALDAVLTAV